MAPHLAAYADQIIIDALWKLLPVAVIAVTFGVVYWFIRRRAAAREKAKRDAWLAERRYKRHGEPPAP